MSHAKSSTSTNRVSLPNKPNRMLATTCRTQQKILPDTSRYQNKDLNIYKFLISISFYYFTYNSFVIFFLKVQYRNKTKQDFPTTMCHTLLNVNIGIQSIMRHLFISGIQLTQMIRRGMLNLTNQRHPHGKLHS